MSTSTTHPRPHPTTIVEFAALCNDLGMCRRALQEKHHAPQPTAPTPRPQAAPAPLVPLAISGPHPWPPPVPAQHQSPWTSTPTASASAPKNEPGAWQKVVSAVAGWAIWREIAQVTVQYYKAMRSRGYHGPWFSCGC